MQAKDIMTTDVVSVGPETTVRHIAGLLVKHGISAVPVVDDAQNVLGIVSEGDLMRRSELETQPRRSWWLTALTSSATLAEEFTKAHGITAADVMTSKVTTVTGEASLTWVADVLESKNIKRVPVVDEGKLVGIVSRANLIQALTTLKDKVIGLASSDDRLIRDALNGTLKNEPWAATSQLNVVVSDGTVHFWGFVESAEQRQALVVAAKNIPGVQDVEDHTTYRPLQFAGQ